MKIGARQLAQTFQAQVPLVFAQLTPADVARPRQDIFQQDVHYLSIILRQILLRKTFHYLLHHLQRQVRLEPA